MKPEACTNQKQNTLEREDLFELILFTKWAKVVGTVSHELVYISPTFIRLQAMYLEFRRLRP